MKNKRELFTQFEENKQLFDEKPKDYLWDILEERLDHKKSIKKLKWYKFIAVAAIGLTLFSVVSLLDHYLSDHNPDYFVSNEGFTSFVLEELENDGDTFFNTSSLHAINSAYLIAQKSEEQVSLAGNYKAIEGAINFDISLENYVYSLVFSYADFPIMILDSISGNTLEFKSEDGKQLKLNIEDSGLQLINSNFLPEYDNFFFKRMSAI